MNLETIASIKDENQSQDFEIDIKATLEPTHCIYRVPENIRKVNEEAYTPKLISVGPLHHGKEELAEMEKQKQQYVESFLKRITIKMEDILNFIQEREVCIHKCYAETSELEVTELVKMITDDAIFIIELFWRNYIGDKSDHLRNIPAVKCALRSDLQLLENQLPYFVLEELYKFTFVAENPTFMDLSYKFFGSYMLNNLPSSLVAVNHFTDLRRSVLLVSNPNVEANGYIGDLPCAVKLHESGVRFKGIEGKGLLEIRLIKRKLFRSFNIHDQLEIPCLDIGDETECLLRNIMALEQCHYSLDTHICNYVDLIDCLINTEKDVDFLVGKGIISNYLGDNAAVSNMFNNLGSHTCISRSCYHNLSEDLKAHYNNPWNKAKANLRSV